MALPKNKARLAGRARSHRQTGSGWQANFAMLYGSPSSPALPRNWRDRLPNAADYYRTNVPHLTASNALGWSLGECAACSPGNLTLAVNLTDDRGSWRCTGCGRGGDLVAHEMMRLGIDFKAAVLLLVRGGG